MTFNLSLPDVRLTMISGSPKLFDANLHNAQFAEKKSSQELWKFISKVGECSPYLNTLIGQEKRWLKTIIDFPVSFILENILKEIRLSNQNNIIQNCKRARRRSFLIVALFDLSGCLCLTNVSRILTIVADEILSALTNIVINSQEILKKESSSKNYDLSNDNTAKKSKKQRVWSKFFVLAMGKMGSHELNYSSDIDIVFFLRSKKALIQEQIEERQEYINKARELIKILSSVANDDFIYRTDLRLRPDPASTPIVISTEFAETYYQKLGRTWERMAFIKARPVAGDKSDADEFLRALENFIWRKHFDYAAIEDVKNLREKMKLDSRSINLENLSGYNIKIGLGGIRDIELFTQTYQLIVGGRQRSLRNSNTISILNRLVEMQWLRKKQSKTLIDAYTFLRSVENRLQIMNNTQIQVLPNENSEKFLALSILLGFGEPEKFKKKLKSSLLYVKRLTDDFFTNFKFREVVRNKETSSKKILPKVAFGDKPLKQENLECPQNLEHFLKMPIFRSDRALKSFKALIPAVTNEINLSTNPSNAFWQFGNFLGNLPSGVQLFPLLENNPSIINLLIQICESSNSITQILAKDITLFDLLISEKFLDIIHTKSVAKSKLRIRLKRNSDYEFILNELRRFVKERKFQICVHLILNKLSSFQAAKLFSDTAEICVDILCPQIKKNLSKRYKISGVEVPCILGMGKLGSREMNFYSDLDLILIYNAKISPNLGENDSSSLPGYFARFTQALVSAFTSLTEEGRLYEVDMRLRPSGRQGPVATSLFSFNVYQNEKAWVWEHMALSRGRIISGDSDLKRQVLKVFNEVFERKIHSAQIIKEQTQKMRQTLGKKFSSVFALPEIKFGRGGMQELELLVQMGFLLVNLNYEYNQQSPRKLIKRLSDKEFFTKTESKKLLLTHNLFFNYQQTYCIFTTKISGKDRLSEKGLYHLLKVIPDMNTPANIQCIEGLHEVLVESANFVGDLFDSKLK